MVFPDNSSVLKMKSNRYADIPDIPIERLDYEYVAKCTSVKELRDILTVLESGKEGSYPDLVSTTEKRLLSLMPDIDRIKYLNLKRTETPSEKAEATGDLSNWLLEINKTDQGITASKLGPKPRRVCRRQIPPPRGHSNNDSDDDDTNNQDNLDPNEETQNPLIQEVTQVNNAPSRWAATGKRDPKARAFKDYYNDWDAFNDEEELSKIETAEGEAKESLERERRLRKAAILKRREELENIGLKIDPSTLSEAERTRLSDRERQKGNECFRATEYEEAMLYYSRSAVIKKSAIVFANRAMAKLRLKQFSGAEADCTLAINLDPSYVKARSRRGVARHRRGNYIGAIKDYCKAIELAPNNKHLGGLLNESRDKYLDVEGDNGRKILKEMGIAIPAPKRAGGFTRMTIVEDDSDSDSDESDDNESLASTVPLNLCGSSFVASSTFCGSRPGYFFQKGIKGIGYYLDEKQSRIKESTSTTQETMKSSTSQETMKSEDVCKIDSNSVEDIDNLSPEKKSEAHRCRGNNCFQSGDLDGAVKEYSLALTANPRNIAAYCNRAAVHLQRGDNTKAEQDTSIALVMAPARDPAKTKMRLKAHFRRGLARKAQNKIDAATEDFAAILSVEPDHPRAIAEMNSMHNGDKINMSKTNKSVDKTTKNQNQKKHVDLFKKTGITRKHRKDSLDAQPPKPPVQSKSFRRIPVVVGSDSEDDNDNVSNSNREAADTKHLQLPKENQDQVADNSVSDCKVANAMQKKLEGNVHFKSKNFIAACSCYDAAIELKIDQSDVYCNKAAALLHLDRLDEVIHCCSDAIKYTKDSKLLLKAYFRRSTAYKRLGDKSECIKTGNGIDSYKASLSDLNEAKGIQGGNTQVQKLLNVVVKLLADSEKLAQQRTKIPSKATEKKPVTINQEVIQKQKERAIKIAESSRNNQNAVFKIPRNAYHFRKEWSSLRKCQESRAKYLHGMRKLSDIKRIFKRSIDTDDLASIVTTIGGKYVTNEPSGALELLTSLSACNGFKTALMMLPSLAEIKLKTIFSTLQSSVSSQTELEALSSKYGISLK